MFFSTDLLISGLNQKHVARRHRNADFRRRKYGEGARRRQGREIRGPKIRSAFFRANGVRGKIKDMNANRVETGEGRRCRNAAEIIPATEQGGGVGGEGGNNNSLNEN